MPDIFFCTAFRRDAFPGRRWLTVLPGISSGGSILSSGFPFFFFRAHAAEGGTGSAPGFRFRGGVKAATHWHFPRTRYCSWNISGKPAKAPELPAAPSAPLAHRAAVLFVPPDTGSRPADNSPCRYIQFRGTEIPAYNMRTGLRPFMCPPDYPFRQAVPDGQKRLS